MTRAVAVLVSSVSLLVAAAPASSGDGSVSWRTLGSSSSAVLPALHQPAATSFAGTDWEVVVFSSASDVTHALPGASTPLRAALERARRATNFGFRRLLLVAVAVRAGCCPFQLEELSSTRRSAALTVRQVACAGCPATGAGFQIVLASVPRASFSVPKRLGLTVQVPPLCPAGYSYAGHVSPSPVELTATLTMDRLPDLVTPMDHALAYASIVARDAEQVPREWLQAGIGRGAIGAYPDDGRAWVYVEAQTTTGYQLTEIAPATVGVPVQLSFTGGGSTWTVAIDGKQAFTADLGMPATGTSTAVEVYRATGGGTCPRLGFALDDVAPLGDPSGLLPVLDQTTDGWTVRLG